jgi:hypothetical protein
VYELASECSQQRHYNQGQYPYGAAAEGRRAADVLRAATLCFMLANLQMIVGVSATSRTIYLGLSLLAPLVWRNCNCTRSIPISIHTTGVCGADCNSMIQDREFEELQSEIVPLLHDKLGQLVVSA